MMRRVFVVESGVTVDDAVTVVAFFTCYSDGGDIGNVSKQLYLPSTSTYSVSSIIRPSGITSCMRLPVANVVDQVSVHPIPRILIIIYSQELGEWVQDTILG